MRHPEIVLAFRELGKHDIVHENVLLKIEAFVCQMYGGKLNDRRINKIRYDRAGQKFHPNGKSHLSFVKGLDISLLPPCHQALGKHILHINYHAHFSSGQGWTLSKN